MIMTIVKNISEIDDMQKAIWRFLDTIEHAFKAAKALDDKVRMERLRKKMLEIDRAFKLQRYELEDSINMATGAERCGNCHNVISKQD